MMLGGWNPLPAQIGGADPPARGIYSSLRSAVGKGGAGPSWTEGGIEDWWRWCKALGLWIGLASVESAASELIPRAMTFNLELWEEALGLTPDAPIEVRRRSIELTLFASLSAIISQLRSYLRETFDPEIEILSPTLEQMCFAAAHRYLKGLPAWGEGQSSILANFSTGFHLTVVWPSMTSEDQRRPMLRALALRVPAWVGFSIVNAMVFRLDGGVDGSSLLDLTGMS